MHEAVKLFDEVCNSRWFSQTPIIIFFNKNDLFQEKIKKHDLKNCFPAYDGGFDAEKALNFIKQQFFTLDQNSKRELFHHLTTATHTQTIRVVFECVRGTILSQTLANFNY